VIIGLVIGGVLVGRDLIDAAAIRSQISQIEKYKTAARTFQVKYGYLPGDIPDPYATQFGFLQRASSLVSPAYSGGGDGNGVIEAYNASGFICNAGGVNQCGNFGILGELMLFWADLSKAGLIEGNFNSFSLIAVQWPVPALILDATSNKIQQVKTYFSAAKIGYGYIIVNSGGVEYDNTMWPNGVSSNGKNYFSTFSMNHWGIQGGFLGNANGYLGDVIFTPAQAYSIDKKTDDGLPQSGKITAMMGGVWSKNLNNPGGLTGDCDNPSTACSTVTSAATKTPVSIYTCYDNGNNGGTEHYSTDPIAVNNINCGLSWEF